MKKQIFLIFFIFALAFFLRVHDLGKESIWLDEAFALEAIDRQIPQVIEWTAAFDPIPPFYYIVLHSWTRLTGISELSIRFPSVILSMAALAIIFFLTKKIFSIKVAIIACAIFATEMLQVQYAQEARSFVLFMFLAWLSTLLFVYFIREERFLIPYVIVSVLALYTLQLMVAVLIIHNIIFFINKTTLIKKWLTAQGAILILFTPWLPTFFKQFLLIHQLFQTGLTERLGLPSLIGAIGILWIFIPFAIGIIALFYLYRTQKKLIIKIVHNEILFITLVILAISAYIFLLPKLISSFIPARYSLFFLPVLYIYFAYMIDRMKNKTATILLILILLLNCFALYTYYSSTTKPEWREAVVYIEENSGKDAVVFDTGFSDMLYKYYGGSLKHYGLKERPFSHSRHAEYIEEIKPELPNTVWLVTYRNFVTKDLFRESLEKDFDLKSRKDFKEISIYRFERT